MTKSKKIKKLRNEEIAIPSGIQASANKTILTIKGKKGELSKDFRFNWLNLKVENEKLIVSSKDAKKKSKMIVNTVCSIAKNMIEGAEKGYYAKLAITYAHFPISATVKPGNVEVTNYFGERNIVKARIMNNSKVEVKGKEITVTGADKNAVGQTAANIERTTKQLEKDRRVFQDGIYITEKGVLNE